MSRLRIHERTGSIENGTSLAVIFSLIGLVVVGLTLLAISVLTDSAVNSIFPNASASEAGSISLSVVSLILNSILTGGLIWIYLRQTRVLEDQRDISEEQASIAEEQTSISKEQTSIQERQQEIMGAEYIPAVDISASDVSEDSVTIHCSNQGTGLAKQFEVEVEFYVGEEAMDGPADYDMGIELVPLSDKVFTNTIQDTPRGEVTVRTNYAGGATTPKRVGAEEDLPQTRTEEILREGDDEDLEFSLYFERYVDPGGEHPSRLSFSEGLERLRDEGVKTIGFSINISYNDIFDNQVANRSLASGWIDIRDGGCAEELFEDAENRTILTHNQPSFDDEGNLSRQNGEKVHRTGHYAYL